MRGLVSFREAASLGTTMLLMLMQTWPTVSYPMDSHIKVTFYSDADCKDVGSGPFTVGPPSQGSGDCLPGLSQKVVAAQFHADMDCYRRKSLHLVPPPGRTSRLVVFQDHAFRSHSAVDRLWGSTPSLLSAWLWPVTEIHLLWLIGNPRVLPLIVTMFHDEWDASWSKGGSFCSAKYRTVVNKNDTCTTLSDKNMNITAWTISSFETAHCTNDYLLHAGVH